MSVIRARHQAVERYALPCNPPVWARGGHLQTLAGHLLSSPGADVEDDPRTRRREIELPDGDRLVAFTRPGTSGVRVHLFHGLSGDAGSDYMRRTAAVMAGLGHEVWAVNHRGCGAGRGLAARPYHSGKTEDLEAVLAESRREAPGLVHLVIGFSLSANLSLLHAAQRREPQPDGLIAVNPPVDLERASVAIGRGLNRIYELRFLWRLRREVHYRERAGLLARHYDIPLTTSLIEFDDLFTAPECGFASGLDYYRRCSALPRLTEIATPAVIVTAGDDPFVDPVVYRDLELPPGVLLHVEPSGGHVGYLSRGESGRRWLDGALAHYVERLAGLSTGAR